MFSCTRTVCFWVFCETTDVTLVPLRWFWPDKVARLTGDLVTQQGYFQTDIFTSVWVYFVITWPLLSLQLLICLVLLSFLLFFLDACLFSLTKVCSLSPFAFMFFLSAVSNGQTSSETNGYQKGKTDNKKRAKSNLNENKQEGPASQQHGRLLVKYLMSSPTCAVFSSISLNASYVISLPTWFCSQVFKDFNRFITTGRPGKYCTCETVRHKMSEPRAFHFHFQFIFCLVSKHDI